MELLKNTNFDFIGKRRIGILTSTVIIIIGLVSLVVHKGPNLGIDFRGGVKIYAKFNRAVTGAELDSKLKQLGYERAKIQVAAAEQEASIDIGYRAEFESQKVVLPLVAAPGDSTATSIQVSRTAEKVHTFQPGDTILLIEGEHRLRNEIREIVPQDDSITFELVHEIGADLTQAAEVQIQASVGRILADALLQGEGDWHAMPGGVNISEVGPSVGKDLKWAALWSIIWSLVVLLAYISYRFEFRFSIGAIVPLIHDVMVTLSIFSLLSKEINLPTVAAFLTIIGFSLNDTIVVFDRIRENTKLLKGWDYADLLNKSINQTLSRTIITSLTVFMVVLALFFFSRPGEEINTFAFAMIVGVIAGSYSTIFIASPILYIWHLRDRQKATSPA